MSTRRKRPQAQKQNRHSNPVMAAAMREFRRGSRTTPVRLEKTYYRPKAKRSWGEDD